MQTAADTFPVRHVSDGSNNRETETAMNTHDTRPHLAVQIITIIVLGIVSIVAVSMAFSETWVAGVAVVALLFPIWMRSPAFTGQSKHPGNTDAKVKEVAPQTPKTKSSGNASFDAYRDEMLARLEKESEEFERFLARLRKARDAKEFDEFMDARVQKSRETAPKPEPARITDETVGY